MPPKTKDAQPPTTAIFLRVLPGNKIELTEAKEPRPPECVAADEFGILWLELLDGRKPGLVLRLRDVETFAKLPGGFALKERPGDKATYGVGIAGVPFFDRSEDVEAESDPGVWLPVDLADIVRIGNAARSILKGLKASQGNPA